MEKQITHFGNPPFLTSRLAMTSIVRTLDEINTEFNTTIGWDIFYNKAGPVRELRIAIANLNNDSKNKAAFISCLLAIATILEDINNKEIG